MDSQSQREIEFLLEKSSEVQVHNFDKAANYNNFVLSLGYAGFFAIWTFVKDQIPDFDEVLSAFLLGLSLFIFIFWTLLNSIFLAFHVRRIAFVLARQYPTRLEKIEALKAAELESHAVTASIYKIWPFVFTLAAATGLLAGGLLFVQLGAIVMGFRFSIADF